MDIDMAPPVAQTVDELLAAGAMIVDIQVGGKPVNPDRTTSAVGTEHVITLDEDDCPHARIVVETVIAYIGDDAPERPSSWQLRVRTRCGDCPKGFDVAHVGRAPQDGGSGVVLDLTPQED